MLPRNRLAITLLLLALVAGVVLVLLDFGRHPEAAPALTPTTDDTPAVTAATSAHGEVAPVREAAGAPRVEIERRSDRDPRLDDPEIVKALCGFKGRIVNHAHEPVAEQRIEMFRFGLETIAPETADLLAGQIAVPEVDAGAATSGADGRFLIEGVWPHGIYAMIAGVGGESPTFQVIERTPGPSEVVDLGDIELKHAATLTGRVVGPDGEPCPGALVRATDLPAAVLQFVPVERFDPDGALIIREGSWRVVMQLPAWARRRFEQLPIPATRTGADGRFVLHGVEPKDVMMAVTAPRLQSHVAPRLRLRAGEVKDVGTIGLREGETVVGRVVDGSDQPVAGAELLLAQASNGAPVDFAQPAIHVGADGKFEVAGFMAGRVTAAARRDASEPWTVVGPQSTSQDCVIRLQSRHTMTFRFTSTGGTKITMPRVAVIAGHDNDFIGMGMFGIVATIGKAEPPAEDGSVRVTNLPPGTYWLLADAAGHAQHSERIEVTGDREVALQLTPAAVFRIMVKDVAGQPIRNASVYVSERGVIDMPMRCGLTAADGSLTITKVKGARAQVSAMHPKYGGGHAEVTLPTDQPAVIVLATPGVLTGVVTEDGRPPALGKWVVTMMPDFRENGAGPLMPRLVVPDAEGKFVATGLKPGQLQVKPILSVRAIQSPGSFMKFATESWMQQDATEQTVTITSGQTVDVALEVNREKVIEGESARLSGTLIVDGVPGQGLVVTASSESGRLVSRVDAAGRFDLGRTKAADTWVQVYETNNDGLNNREQLWSRNVSLKPNEDKNLEINLTTASMTGVVLDTEGAPVEGCMVNARGHIGDKPEERIWVRREAVSNAQGRFELKRMPGGQYSLEARKESGGGRATLGPIKVESGVPAAGVELRLQRTVVVKGRIDMAVFGGKTPEHVGLNFTRVGGGSNAHAQVDDQGTFQMQDVIPGSYEVSAWAWSREGEPGQYRSRGQVEVGPNGADGLVLTLEKRVEKRE